MAEYKGVSGALYTNSYKSSENQPDYTGEVDLSKEVIDAIRQQMESKVNGKGVPIDLDEGTGFPRISLAAWVRDGKNSFLSKQVLSKQRRRKKKMISPSSMIERHSKDYYKAKSFDVVVEVKYRRTRKVRALDKEQAKEFAVQRETEMAQKRYDKLNHIDYSLESARAVKASLSEKRDHKSHRRD